MRRPGFGGGPHGPAPFGLVFLLLFVGVGAIGDLLELVMPLAAMALFGFGIYSLVKLVLDHSDNRNKSTSHKTTTNRKGDLSNRDIVSIDRKLRTYFSKNVYLPIIEGVNLTCQNGSYVSIDRLYITNKDEKICTLGDFKSSHPDMYRKIVELLSIFAKQEESTMEETAPANEKKEDRSLSEAEKFIEKINTLNEAIPNEEITNSLYLTSDLLKQIDLSKDSKSDKAKVDKLYSYYLPILLGILEKYKKLQDTGVRDEEFTKCQTQLIKTILLINQALKNILSEMHEDDYMNLNADIDTLQALLSKDGYLEEDPFKKGGHQ